MGSVCAKEEAGEPEKAADEIQVFWDDHGVLRRKDLLAAHKPARELQLVKQLSSRQLTWAPNQVFYVIHAPWVEGWLAYVRSQGVRAPQPAPIDNDKLLDGENKEIRRRRRCMRHFRIVTEQVWVIFSSLYSVRGATITVLAPSEQAAQEMADMNAAEREAVRAVEEHRSTADSEGTSALLSQGAREERRQAEAKTHPVVTGMDAAAPDADAPYDPYADFSWVRQLDLAKDATLRFSGDAGAGGGAEENKI